MHSRSQIETITTVAYGEYYPVTPDREINIITSDVGEE